MDDKEKQTFLELQAKMVDHTSKLKTVGCHFNTYIGILTLVSVQRSFISAWCELTGSAADGSPCQ